MSLINELMSLILFLCLAKWARLIGHSRNLLAFWPNGADKSPIICGPYNSQGKSYDEPVITWSLGACQNNHENQKSFSIILVTIGWFGEVRNKMFFFPKRLSFYH